MTLSLRLMIFSLSMIFSLRTMRSSRLRIFRNSRVLWSMLRKKTKKWKSLRLKTQTMKWFETFRMTIQNWLIRFFAVRYDRDRDLFENTS
jgi:hypothetical protein